MVSKPRRLSPKEVQLLKRTVAKGTSDDEFALFLWVCRKHKVDPLTRQIHCVRRWLNKHHQDDKGIWQGGYQMTIQMGIDGYRALAARDHADFGGCDEAEFEYDGGTLPILARIRLWKKDLEHPIVGVCRWIEFAPRDLEKPEAFFWKKMPTHMLAKCAEALALRKGYPELADIYTNEEMAQADDNFTPEGRQIIDAQVVSNKEAHEAAQEMYRKKKAEFEEKIQKQKTVAENPELQASIWPKKKREPGEEG